MPLIMETNRAVYGSYAAELELLGVTGSLRALPQAESRGRWISRDGRRMLNLSSNDYLGLGVWRRNLRTACILPPPAGDGCPCPPPRPGC